MGQAMAKSDYLDPRWQKRRLEILERDNWTCYACGSKDDTLHVHHVMYCGKPWEAPASLLQTLCETCHSMLGPHRRAGIGYVWEKDGPPEIDMHVMMLVVIHCPMCGGGDSTQMKELERCSDCDHDLDYLNEIYPSATYCGTWFSSTDEFIESHCLSMSFDKAKLKVANV